MASGERVTRILIIAGSDSSGGAGMQRDLQVARDMGALARCAITAVTAQTDERVQRVEFMPSSLVAAQIECALQSGVDAIKIGMLGNAAIVRAVAEILATSELPIVIDPVLLSSSGTSLLDDEGRDALMRLLAPRAALLTPNLPEARALLGGSTPDANTLATLSACPVLLKGGHADDSEAIDWLCHEGALTAISGPRFATQMRGSGCALSTAIAIALARGESLLDACRQAKDYVAQLLQQSGKYR